MVFDHGLALSIIDRLMDEGLVCILPGGGMYHCTICEKNIRSPYLTVKHFLNMHRIDLILLGVCEDASASLGGGFTCSLGEYLKGLSERMLVEWSEMLRKRKKKNARHKKKNGRGVGRPGRPRKYAYPGYPSYYEKYGYYEKNGLLYPRLPEE